MENVCMIQKKGLSYLKGAILEAQPTKGSGYNQTNVSQPLYGEGRWSFGMERRQKRGAAGEVKENRNFI